MKFTQTKQHIRFPIGQLTLGPFCLKWELSSFSLSAGIKAGIVSSRLKYILVIILSALRA